MSSKRSVITGTGSYIPETIKTNRDFTLHNFYDVFKNKQYFNKMKSSFDWFHGSNHLDQIIYNPGTGGCYDGMEAENVNLNQGAESTVSYHMARFAVEKALAGDMSEHKKMGIAAVLAA